MHRVHTTNISRAERQSLWDEITQDYLSSGESARDYSERHGLKYDHLNYYVSSYRRKQKPVTSFMALEGIPRFECSSTIELSTGTLSIRLPSNVSLLTLEAVLKRFLAC